MSFNSRENSLADGAPIRLYQFSRGVMRWLNTSGDRDEVVGSNTDSLFQLFGRISISGAMGLQPCKVLAAESPDNHPPPSKSE